MWTYTTDSTDFVTVSTGLILPYWMGLPIRYIHVGFLRRNLRPIVNSLTRIKVYRKSARTEKEYYARLSNGPMESFNRKPKDLKRDSRGFSGFNYTRNRILWATRKNPSIKGVPKSMDQILSKKGKKRGSYKKKNQK